MKYACPQCGTAYELGPEHYNQRLECQCGEKIMILPFESHKPAIFPIVMMVLAILITLSGFVIHIIATFYYLNDKENYVMLNFSCWGQHAFLLGMILICLCYIASQISRKTKICSE